MMSKLSTTISEFKRNQIELAHEALVSDLVSVRNEVNCYGGLDAEIDVRLCADTSDTTEWVLLSGDVSFDARHYAHCAAGTVHGGDPVADLEQLAHELIDEVLDSLTELEA